MGGNTKSAFKNASGTGAAAVSAASDTEGEEGVGRPSSTNMSSLEESSHRSSGSSAELPSSSSSEMSTMKGALTCWRSDSRGVYWGAGLSVASSVYGGGLDVGSGDSGSGACTSQRTPADPSSAEDPNRRTSVCVVVVFTMREPSGATVTVCDSVLVFVALLMGLPTYSVRFHSNPIDIHTPAASTGWPDANPA